MAALGVAAAGDAVGAAAGEAHAPSSRLPVRQSQSGRRIFEGRIEGEVSFGIDPIIVVMPKKHNDGEENPCGKHRD
jgi:hypothetical protein